MDGSSEALRVSVRAVIRGGHPADTLLVDVLRVILNGFSANGKSRIFTELEKAKAAELLADADLNLVVFVYSSFVYFTLLLYLCCYWELLCFHSF